MKSSKCKCDEYDFGNDAEDTLGQYIVVKLEWERAKAELIEASKIGDKTGSADMHFRDLHIRRAKLKLIPNCKPSNVLKVETYKLYQRYDDQDLLHALGRLTYRKFASHARPNLFYNLLMLILVDKPEFISKTSLLKYSHQLEYAYKHDIDPNLLIGFIYQAGRNLITYKNRLSHQEHGLEYLSNDT